MMQTAVCIIEASGAMGTIAPQCNGAHGTQAPFQFRILGNALYSQVAIHAPYGGVFPNLAKREHAKNLVPLLTQALKEASVFASEAKQSRSNYTDSGLLRQSLAKTDHEVIQNILAREPELLEQLSVFLEQYEKPDIDAIAVTAGPGLEPALWVGVNFARALSTVWNVPIVAINHMEGHILMSMAHDGGFASFEFPILSLLISGGHTELVLSKSWMHYERIGETRDDAVGEAFDKVARLLDLPYPGGPEISRLAAEARKYGDAISIFSFTPPMLHSGDFDFSFSGIKTEVRKLVESLKPLSDDTKREIARAFEDAVTHVLVEKTIKAAEEYGAQTIIVGGGVSANTYIRAALFREAKPRGITVLVPPPDLATDNAIMIALAGYFHAVKNDFADAETLRANGNLKLG